MGKRNSGGVGVDNNTTLTEAVDFHFIFRSRVRMNLENDIRGALDCDQFVCTQTVLAVYEGDPCLYAFILLNKCFLQNALGRKRCVTMEAQRQSLLKSLVKLFLPSDTKNRTL